MKEDIYTPLQQYREEYKEKFLEVAARTFDELADASGVNVVENKATCDEIRRLSSLLDHTKSKQLRWRILCGVLYSLVLVGLVFVWYIVKSGFGSFGLSNSNNSIILTIIVVLIIGIVCSLFVTVHPKMKAIGGEREEIETKISELTDLAWQQMQPLNRLYDWDIFARMMCETMPEMEFDPFFTVERLADLKRVYGWDESFNEERSVLYSHSGMINGNPFVLCRTRRMEMGTKTYHGSKTIHWRTMERNSDGKWESVLNSETLTASVTAPYPLYYETTHLIYGNIAAPDLCFDRTKSNVSDEQGSLSYNWKLRSLKKRAEKKDSNFALMQNEDFEVLFNTENRNNEQQFRLLFTPLAQQCMLELLRDDTDGYGDDFDFSKNRMINFIVSDHIQDVEFDMDPAHYRHYDFEYAKENFVKQNAEYFRAMYFCLAPLLCVPMYQQIRTHENIYGHAEKAKSAFWEHEALANFWGEDIFKHPNCATQNILKTSEEVLADGGSEITVYAHGYEAVKRMHYEEKWGGDGKLHSVPVEWYEYLPVVGNGSIFMNEDTDDNAGLNPIERQSHIATRLVDVGGSGIYRRHIASHL